MPTHKTTRRDEWTTSLSKDADTRLVSNECLTLRNYDDDRAHEIQIRFIHHNGDVVLARTVSVPPRETVSIHPRVERAMYRVTARLENGETATADCLLGSDPSECAMVETGNGLLSVVDGPF
jgi:hypothetical protein